MTLRSLVLPKIRAINNCNQKHKTFSAAPSVPLPWLTYPQSKHLWFFCLHYLLCNWRSLFNLYCDQNFNDFHRKIQNLPLKQENLSWKQKDSPQASCHEGITHCPLYHYSTSDADVSADLWDTRACVSGKGWVWLILRSFNPIALYSPGPYQCGSSESPPAAKVLLTSCHVACLWISGEGFWHVPGASKQTREGSLAALFISP